MNSKRALVLTNHLHDYAGSEVLSLEVAETLAEMGFEVRIHCNSHDPGIRSINPSIPVSDSDQFPDIFDYDFVWSQHLLIPIAVSQHGLRRTHRTRIVSAHLSPFEPFEMTGLKSALILGASIAANSFETAERLQSLGVDDSEIHNLHNACPDRYWVDHPRQKPAPGRILWVSNHLPQEVPRALKLLKSTGTKVEHIGNRGTKKRVTPEDIRSADAVISIGKTVQYAIKAGVPVYCYDHFGGPGWITRDSYETAERFNYSGRCCRRKLPPEAIAKEITAEFETAAQEVLLLREHLKERYSLERFLHLVTEKLPARQFESEDHYRIARTQLALEASQGYVVRKLYRANQQRRLKNKIRAKISKILPAR
jgi:hypothetical protein